MVLMGQGIAKRVPGRPARARHGAAAHHAQRDRLRASPLLVNISAGYPGTKEWVQQVNCFHPPMVSVHRGERGSSSRTYGPASCAACSAEMADGEYEVFRKERGAATSGMDAQSWPTCSSRSASCSATSCTARAARKERPRDDLRRLRRLIVGAAHALRVLVPVTRTTRSTSSPSTCSSACPRATIALNYWTVVDQYLSCRCARR